MAALEKEKSTPQADTAYYSGAIGFQAAGKGLHQPTSPRTGGHPGRFEGPERPLVDGPHQRHRLRGQHQGWRRSRAAALGRPSEPVYREDRLRRPTWGGTSFTLVYG